MTGAERSRRLAAEAWARHADLIDRQLSPLGLRAMDTLSLPPGATVLDVGCGTGQTLTQLAARVGETGAVIGVDIAPQLLAVAAARTAQLPQVRLVQADAQVVERPDASVDAVFSRFGVMAFADPTAAFTNLRRILKPGGRLGFVCWQPLADNPLDLAPLQAAGLERLADATPFSLAEPPALHALLAEAGFHHVGVAPHAEPVSSGDLDEMATVLLAVGPLGRILRERPDLRADAEPRVRAGLAARSDGPSVALTAAVWIVTARA